MLRKTLALAVLALAIPAVALAAKPTTHTSQSKSTANPTVTYILKGTLSSYTAATSTTTGSITINVTHSNYHARTLVGQSWTFSVSTNTTTNASTINDNTRGIVKFRAAKKQTSSGLTAALAPNSMTATQIVAR